MFRAPSLRRSLLAGFAFALGCDASPELETLQADPPELWRTSYEATASNEPIRPLEPIEGLDPAKIELGRRLFHDARLSADNTVSCASCHDLRKGGDDGLTTSVGIRDQQGTLNAPTVLNAGLSIAQFWDGRAATLEEQAEGPIHNPLEMGSNWEEVTRKLSRDHKFNREFKRSYPEGFSGETIADAIATFERSLITLDAPFDCYLRGDEYAISDVAKRGYELFKTIGCVSCHQGRMIGGNMFQEFGVMTPRRDWEHQPPSDRGRFNVTRRSEDLFRFKVPTLRNVALTAPYFHRGQAETLNAAIEEMAESQLGASLNPEEVSQIRAFLETLTGLLPGGGGDRDRETPREDRSESGSGSNRVL